MKKDKIFRLVSLIMLIIAVIFIIIVSNVPILNTMIIVLTQIQSQLWTKLYVSYLLLMIGLFICSFFVNKWEDE